MSFPGARFHVPEAVTLGESLEGGENWKRNLRLSRAENHTSSACQYSNNEKKEATISTLPFTARKPNPARLHLAGSLIAPYRPQRIAEASPRICQLAVPKKIWAPSFEKTNFTLKNPSKAEPSSRILLLAVPKKEHQDFVPNRPLSWHVAKSVLVAVASERLLELAVPKSRKPLFEERNPYKVSPAALSATASPRILELSLPSPRWCRTKSAQM
ncbi:hypothetical protein C0J50_23918 [Silurus asotus]|uniref:Uncharacterized protein n=1 Tax=Silurus asotus TaxID=30991 RepID=A0AAD5AIQ4_SILAS|nr:hypothetical protein C0J50_23918 [Silurus asotus]